MISDEEMKSGNIFNLFSKFVFPAMVGVVISGIQGIIDGFFVGKVIGSQGLAGITLAYPPYVLIIALGVLVGTGASSLTALELGKGNKKEALNYAHNAFLLSLLIGAILTAGGLFFCEKFMYFLGDKGPVLNFAREYLRIIFMGSVFMVLSLVLDPLVRNDGKPKLCMNVMVVGVIANVSLDYFFVMRLGMGMAGAAIATAISFALPALLLMYHLFVNGTKLKFRFRILKFKIKTSLNILQTGLPAFLTQLSLALVLFAYNFMLLRYGSELEVSAYGIIGYICASFYMLFEGVALGVQPIIGFNYGAGHYDRVSQALKLSIFTSILIGTFGFMLIYLFPESVVSIFIQNNSKLMEVTVQGMSIFMLSLLVEGAVLLTAIYFQSINRVRKALFINLGKIFFVLLPLLFILPLFFGLNGIWSASPASEYIMTLAVFGMLSKEFKFLKECKTVNEENSEFFRLKNTESIETL